MTTAHSSHSVKTRWKEVGAEVVVVPEDAGGEVDLSSVLENLGQRGWLEVYCEGGARMASSLLRNDLVDRLEINYGPVLLGGDAIGLADLGVETMAKATRWHLVNSARMGDDVLVVYERGR
jgi:diaminohydroxyphosphoribosylaminopyrimidine deaminase/5-amino-6-(5-phosphoribosylamino)uracil reductase